MPWSSCEFILCSHGRSLNVKNQGELTKLEAVKNKLRPYFEIFIYLIKISGHGTYAFWKEIKCRLDLWLKEMVLPKESTS